MTEKEELFVHFVSCIQDLNNAWRILQEIKTYNGSSIVRGAAFQFALVEYSKPYKHSRGSVLTSKGKSAKYRVKREHVPAKYVQLHERILKARDQIHAHSDLTVKDAKLYVQGTSSGNTVSGMENNIYGTEELANMEEIIELIEQTLESMYATEKRLEQQLPPNTW